MAESLPSARYSELLELTYSYVLEHGLAGLSLRPLATEIGSSPRVLLYLFGSKEELVRAVLARARQDELSLLRRLEPLGADNDLEVTAATLWQWLARPEHRGILVLWVEAYSQSLTGPDGPWADFAATTVTDWLDLLCEAQPEGERHTPEAAERRTAVLAILRGALLDLLATGDARRTTAAVDTALAGLVRGPS